MTNIATLKLNDKSELTELPNGESFGEKSLIENIKLAENAIESTSYTERIWDRSRSQWMLKHLTCSHSGAWLRIRQISAEMAQKRLALNEAKHNYMRLITQTKIKRREANREGDELHRELILIEISELESNAKNILIKIEGALKEILLLKELHDSFIAKFGDVSEEKFEEEETNSHIARVFNQALRDARQYNCITTGNQEYMEQIGINVSAAEIDIMAYLRQEREKLELDTKMLNSWIEEMQNKYRHTANIKCVLLGYDAAPLQELMQPKIVGE